MGYWNTRGLRGSAFEEIINKTNDVYRQQKLAIIQKIPTSITPVQFDKENRTITLAYFEQRSTVDYMGVVQGIPVCFDAKETALKNLPLKNIHAHQIEFMDDFQQNGGASFLLVYFRAFDEAYFLPFSQLKAWYEEAKVGGRKSIPYDSFDKKYRIQNKQGYLLHYLEPLNLYVSNL